VLNSPPPWTMDTDVKQLGENAHTRAKPKVNQAGYQAGYQAGMWTPVLS